ncbi:MAG: prephenate dehydratase [Clostridia bacterium]|nr:prephenate dehydratase [Clostridia bacterium]
MENLEYYRAEIDKIDTELIALMEKRMDVAKHIGEIKLKSGMQVLDTAREEKVLRSRMEKVTEKEYEGVIEEFFVKVMALSRGVQQNLIDSYKMKQSLSGKACYQGVDGGYGSIAASKVFGENIYNVKTFENVIEEVERGNADYGVLPMENSTTGSITDVLDMLCSHEVYIVGETAIKVEHNLLALPEASLSDITDVYSHEQGFFQCKEFLKDKNWRLNSVVNTAVGAKSVSEEGNVHKAAIASKRAAKLYGLKVLCEDVASGKANATRFIIISKKPQMGEGATKAAVVFSVPHVSGALVSALEIFARHSVNLLKIESRPVIDRMGEYRFFAELEGNIGDENMINAIGELKKYATSYKYLGNFKKI